MKITFTLLFFCITILGFSQDSELNKDSIFLKNGDTYIGKLIAEERYNYQFLILGVKKISIPREDVAKLIVKKWVIGENNNFLIREKVLDSLTGSQKQLFSKTKMFIGEQKQLLQGAIQNEEIESHLILYSGVIQSTSGENMNYYNVTHFFNYTLKFFHKDSKAKIIFQLTPVSDRISVEASATGNTLSALATGRPNTNTFNSNNSAWKKIDITKEWEGLMKTGISKKGFYLIKNDVQTKVDLIISEYEKYMKEISNSSNDW